MSLFQEAAHLNNEGIVALLEGNQMAAIRSMGKAIKLMKSELAQMGCNSTSGAGADTKNTSQDTTTTSTYTVEIPSMESSDTIIFNHVIRIPAELCATHISKLDKNVYTGAVVFNLALAHHFLGSAGDALCMAKAEKLYSMVLKLLDGNALNVHTALIVKLACINNLSQIRYSKGDYANAREGLTDVSKFMSQTKNPAMFEEREIQGLLMNVLLLKAPKVASAA